MIAGMDDSDTALAHARELLDAAQPAPRRSADAPRRRARPRGCR